MEWVMLIAFNFTLYQVPFESAALCEAAKLQLAEENGLPPASIACVQVATRTN